MESLGLFPKDTEGRLKMNALTDFYTEVEAGLNGNPELRKEIVQSLSKIPGILVSNRSGI